MLALVKRDGSPGLSLDEVDRPVPAPDEVLVRIRKTGICGTDGHIYAWDEWARNRIRPPLIVGHEFMGVVESVGASVHGFRPGETVSGEGHISCGHCFFCRTGQGHICRNLEIIGVDRDGCFAQFLRMPQGNLWRVKPGIADEVAAVFDPLGNAMHTVMAQPVSGRVVAVVGAGAIGLMACKIASLAGALSVIAIEPHPSKRVLALESGAQIAFDPSENGWLDQCLALTPEGAGADVVLEMSGSPPGIRSAFDLARPGADVALLGIPPSDVSLNLSDAIIFKGITVRGINGRRMFETWYQCERFLLQRGLDVLPLITHRLPYSRFQEAFDILQRGEAVKIILEWE